MIWVFLPVILCLIVVMRSGRENQSRQTEEPLDEIQVEVDSTPDLPVAFGFKMSWLAIRTKDFDGVCEAIGISDQQSANWADGIKSAYKRFTFVSPPTAGWVFVVSRWIPEISKPNSTAPDRLTPLLQNLSETFGEAQYFGTHRVVDYHAWALAIDGAEIRAFAYLGETGEILADRGNETEAEQDLGFDFAASLSPDDSAAENSAASDLITDDGDRFPDESDVMLVAEKWSLNPQTLPLPESHCGVGAIGTVPLWQG